MAAKEENLKGNFQVTVVQWRSQPPLHPAQDKGETGLSPQGEAGQFKTKGTFCSHSMPWPVALIATGSHRLKQSS